MLFGPRQDREQRRPETRHALEFGLSPRPVVVHGRRAEAKLVADSVGRLALSGRVTATAPDGLRVRPGRMAFEGAATGRRRTQTVTLERRARLAEGGYFVECTARLDRAVYRERQPVIVLGDPEQSVTVKRAGKRRELFRADNGVLTLTVAPDFGGAAVSLERGGEQLLRSAYPEARPLAWSNPWLGGIQPTFAEVAAQELWEQGFRARAVRRRGRQGIVWEGVRVSSTGKTERVRGDGVVLDYLLAPGSCVLAVAVRTRRRRGASGWVHGGFDLWPTLGGSYLDAVLSGEADPRATRLRCEYGGDVRGERWAMAEDPKTGDAVALVCAGGEAGTGGNVVGRDGYSLGCGRGATQDAGETRESVFYIAYVGADRVGDLAAALAELKELP
jgi:hypothetical protein